MRHLFLLLGCAMFLIACGGSTTSPEDASVDAARSDSGSSGDAGGSLDASSDAGSTNDAGSADDAGSTSNDAGPCPGVAPIDDHLSGVCDGIGRMGCAMWATTNGGPDAVAQCVPPEGRCARANACTAEGCTCGGAPECAGNQMCAGTTTGGFSCVCLVAP